MWSLSLSVSPCYGVPHEAAHAHHQSDTMRKVIIGFRSYEYQNISKSYKAIQVSFSNYSETLDSMPNQQFLVTMGTAPKIPIFVSVV